AAACARCAGRTVSLCDWSPPRHVDAAPARPSPASTTACIRDAPPRRRRPPANDPGAARPQLALDDTDVPPRPREAPAPRLRPRASTFVEPQTCSGRAEGWRNSLRGLAT